VIVVLYAIELPGDVDDRARGRFLLLLRLGGRRQACNREEKEHGISDASHDADLHLFDSTNVRLTEKANL
jgi:hypothetical protein